MCMHSVIRNWLMCCGASWKSRVTELVIRKGWSWAGGTHRHGLTLFSTCRIFSFLLKAFVLLFRPTHSNNLLYLDSAYERLQLPLQNSFIAAPRLVFNWINMNSLVCHTGRTQVGAAWKILPLLPQRCLGRHLLKPGLRSLLLSESKPSEHLVM